MAGIAAVSGGALVAAAWAGGADLDKLVDRAVAPPPLDVGARLGRRACCRAPGWALLIDEFLPVPTFEGLRVPVRVLATDVDTGEPVVFREGDLREAVRASCSFPGVFPPMVLDGPAPLDGGVSEVVPVRLAREMAGDGGRGAGGGLQRGRALAGRRLVRGHGAARRPDAAPRAHARRAGGRRPGDRAGHRASRAGCGRADPAVRRGRASEAAGEALPELRRLIGAVTRRAVTGCRRRWPCWSLAGVLAVAASLSVRAPPGPTAPGWRGPASRRASWSAAGCRVRYVRAGSGPPVVLLHGFASSVYTWRGRAARAGRAATT